MKTAVYAGSFDPPTNGHVWMIEQGAKLFDKLIVAVGTNPDKSYAFSAEERVAMLKEITKGSPHITVESFKDQYLVEYTKKAGANYMLRGIRSTPSYEYERGMKYVNSDMEPGVATVFLMPPRNLAEISSSLVKGMVGPEGWETMVSKYVPHAVLEFLKKLKG